MSRFTGPIRWRVADGTPADVVTSVRPHARKLMGALMSRLSAGGLTQGAQRATLPDGTTVTARFDGTTPIVEIAAATTSEETDECEGLLGHVSAGVTVADWPIYEPRSSSVAPYRVMRCGIGVKNNRVYMIPGENLYGDVQDPGVYEFDPRRCAMVALDVPANDTFGGVGVLDGLAHGVAVGPGIVTDALSFAVGLDAISETTAGHGSTADLFYPLHHQDLFWYKVASAQAGSLQIGPVDAPSLLDRVFAQGSYARGRAGVNRNGEALNDVYPPLPAASVPFDATTGLKPGFSCSYSDGHGRFFTTPELVVTDLADQVWVPTIVGYAHGVTELFGFLRAANPAPAAQRHKVGAVMDYVTAPFTSADAFVRLYARDFRSQPYAEVALSMSAQTSYSALPYTTAQVCSSLVTAGCFKADGTLSGDVMLHVIGTDTFRKIGHIPELEQTYARWFAIAVAVHNAIYVFVPVLAARASEDPNVTDHVVTDYKVYTIT